MITQVEFDEVARSIDIATPLCGTSILVTIDGPAGAGKSTLSSRLTRELNGLGRTVTIIHLDNMYNGWLDAFGPSLTRTLSEEVLTGISSGLRYGLPQFDWSAQRFSEPSIYEPANITIVEGVGCGQEVLRPKTSVAIWIDIDDDIGITRVLERDGQEIWAQMKRFQADQKVHFGKAGSKLAADYRFDGAP